MKWPMVKLADVCQVNPRLPKECDETQDVSFLAMASVSEDGILLNQETRVLSETKKGFTYFERGDVIVAKITPCFENGKAAYLDSLQTQVGFGSTEFHVLRPDIKQLDGKYLFYLIWNQKFRFIAERSMSGSAGQKRVPASFLQNFEVPLPPLKEQKRIVTILDKADAIRQKRQQAIALADDFLRSVFLDMFVRAADNWTVKTIDYIADKEKGGLRTGPFGSQLLHSEFVDSGIPVLGIDNAVKNVFKWGKARFITDEKYKSLSRYTVHPEDVLITIMGTCGRCAVVPDDIPTAINTKHLCCISLDYKKALPEFLHSYYLFHPMSRQYLAKVTKGAIMDGLNMGLIKAMPFPMVPIKLQEKYVEIKMNVLSSLDKQHLSESNQEDLFNSLSQQFFVGKCLTA